MLKQNKWSLRGTRDRLEHTFQGPRIQSFGLSIFLYRNGAHLLDTFEGICVRAVSGAPLLGILIFTVWDRVPEPVLLQTSPSPLRHGSQYA